MITIAVLNSKGGVGKTTLTACLAVRAAQEGKRIALVDMDPQGSLIKWWQRRGKTDNPRIFEGPDTAPDAIEALELDTTHGAPWDYVFLDGPPAFLELLKEMIEAADFVLIPVKPSMLDLLASEDAVSFAQQAGTDYAVVFNDVGAQEKIVDKAKEFLFSAHVPMLRTQVVHRTAYINSMTSGKTAGESADKKAQAEIGEVWADVKKLATAAAKKRAKKKEVANG